MSLPAVPGSFQWTQESWGAGLRCVPLAAIAPHVFTTRQLAFTSSDDERQLADALGAETLAMATQVHGRGVIVIRRGMPLPGGRPEGDAFVSDSPTTAIGVRAADCVPLLMADRIRGVVAAVHAGWRGTAARAAVAALDALGREFGTTPADLIAAIGPSIGACCYEVGSDLVDAFAAAGHERWLVDRWFVLEPPASAEGVGEASRITRRWPKLRLDVAGANRDQLVLAGVPEDQIFMSGLCTAMHLDVLTSYRAEKEKAARIVGAIRASH